MTKSILPTNSLVRLSLRIKKRDIIKKRSIMWVMFAIEIYGQCIKTIGKSIFICKKEIHTPLVIVTMSTTCSNTVAVKRMNNEQSYEKRDVNSFYFYFILCEW